MNIIISSKYKLFMISFKFMVLCAICSFSFNASAAKKLDKKTVINKAIKAMNKYNNADEIKRYFLSQALNDKEARAVEKLYVEIFGNTPTLTKVNIIKDIVYSNGVSTNIAVKLTPKGMALKRGSLIVEFKSKDRVINYLKKLKRFYHSKSTANNNNLLFNLLITEAIADNSNSGIGFVLYHILSRPGEPEHVGKETCSFRTTLKEWVTWSKADCEPVKQNTNPRRFNPDICSFADRGIRDHLLETFVDKNLNNAVMSSRWRDKSNFSINYNSNNRAQDFAAKAKVWLENLKATGKYKTLKCDLSNWPQVTAYFSRHKENDMKLTSDPYEYETTIYMTDTKKPTTTIETQTDGSTIETFADNKRVQTLKDGTKVYLIGYNSRVPSSNILSQTIETRKDGTKVMRLKIRTTKLQSELFGTGLTGRYTSYYASSTIDSNPPILISSDCVQATDSILHDLTATTTEVCKYIANNPEENPGINIIPPKSQSIDTVAPNSSKEELTVD